MYFVFPVVPFAICFVPLVLLEACCQVAFKMSIKWTKALVVVLVFLAASIVCIPKHLVQMEVLLRSNCCLILNPTHEVYTVAGNYPPFISFQWHEYCIAVHCIPDFHSSALQFFLIIWQFSVCHISNSF